MPSLKSGTNGSEIKAHNTSAILLNLLHADGLSRVALADMIGVSTTTITNLVAELIEQGIVVEEGILRSGSVGRPQMALQLEANSRFALAIQIEAGRARIAISDLRACPIAKQQHNFAVTDSAETVLGEIVTIAQGLIEQHGIDPRLLVGAGVIAPGLVDPQQGLLISSSQLGWHQLPLRSYFSNAFKLPVRLDNNVRGMTLGEATFGVAQGAAVMVFVYIRLGVGSGMAVNGRLYHGAAAAAGEIGHATVILEGGERCHCGNTGCLETLISESAIIRLAEAIQRQQPKGLLARYMNESQLPMIERILAAARAGDSATLAMLQERARYLGITLANVVNLINPHMIVIGGIFAQGQDLLLPTLTQTVAERAFAGLGKEVTIQATQFGDDVGVVGASALALDAFFYQNSTPQTESEFLL